MMNSGLFSNFARQGTLVLIITISKTLSTSEWPSIVLSESDITSCQATPGVSSNMIFPWFFDSTTAFDSIDISYGVDSIFIVRADGRTDAPIPGFTPSFNNCDTSVVEDMYRRLPGSENGSIPSGRECSVIYMERSSTGSETYRNTITFTGDSLDPMDITVTYSSDCPDPLLLYRNINIGGTNVTSRGQTISKSVEDRSVKISAVPTGTPEQVILKIFYEGSVVHTCSLDSDCLHSVPTGTESATLHFFFYYHGFQTSPQIETVNVEFEESVEDCGPHCISHMVFAICQIVACCACAASAYKFDSNVGEEDATDTDPPASVVVTPATQTVVEGSDLTFTCKSVCYPGSNKRMKEGDPDFSECKISWTKEGEGSVSGTGERGESCSKTGKDLNFKAVSRTDAGKYMCTVNIGETSSTAEVELIVKYWPKVYDIVLMVCISILFILVVTFMTLQGVEETFDGAANIAALVLGCISYVLFCVVVVIVIKIMCENKKDGNPVNDSGADKKPDRLATPSSIAPAVTASQIGTKPRPNSPPARGNKISPGDPQGD